jgi:hypothetical protein
MAIAYQASLSARSRSPRPRARAIAVTTPPPTAPCETAPTNENTGKMSETPARTSTPRRARKKTLTRPIAIWENITSAFGMAIRSSVGTTGSSSNWRVRRSNVWLFCETDDVMVHAYGNRAVSTYGINPANDQLDTRLIKKSSHAQTSRDLEANLDFPFRAHAVSHLLC